MCSCGAAIWRGLTVNRIRSSAMVAVQFAVLAYLLMTGPLLANRWGWAVLEIAGFVVIIAAVLTMNIRRVTAFPEPRADAQLLTRGPYRYIRHPMYAGAMLCVIALVLYTRSPGRTAAFVILLINLWLKMRYEETLLLQRFPEYAELMRRTKRLIPFVY